MFTGIVEFVGEVAEARARGGIKRIRVRAPGKWKLRVGESIAVDGICSTVVARAPGHFDVEYMEETLRKTTANDFAKGKAVNLERSLALGDRLEGHFVFGHVDARGTIVSCLKDRLSIALPRHLVPLAPALGAISINGVALTVASERAGKMEVALIPHTIAHTNLGQLKKGDMVNVEIDLLARYVASLTSRGRVVSDAKTRHRRL